MWAFKFLRVAVLISVVMGSTAYAQILLGQTAGFSGTVVAGVKEAAEGATLHFDSVNSKGGINGQKIELI